MEIRMGMSTRMEVRQALEVRLTAEQRLLVRTRLFALRLALVEDLREERYVPRGACPNCRRQLTAVEILSGFNRDPVDFTTGCPKCRYRFEPRLICFGNGSEIELPFFCEAQTLARLSGLETLPPDQLAQKHPALYRSAIVHLGGIGPAFKKIGLAYPFEEISGWRNKVVPFLGRLPDVEIARCAGVRASAVRKIRRELGVPPYSRRKSLAEAEVEE